MAKTVDKLLNCNTMYLYSTLIDTMADHSCCTPNKELRKTNKKSKHKFLKSKTKKLISKNNT